jgi:hypothetical protein
MEAEDVEHDSEQDQAGGEVDAENRDDEGGPSHPRAARTRFGVDENLISHWNPLRCHGGLKVIAQGVN